MSKVVATLTAKRKEKYNEKHKNDEGFTPLPKGDEKIKGDFNFGATAAEMIELFGDEVVKSNAISQISVGIQESMRRWRESGLSDEQIQEKLDSYKPGVVSRVPGQSFKAKTAEKFKKMSEAEQSAFLEMLMEAAGGGEEEAEGEPEETETEEVEEETED